MDRWIVRLGIVVMAVFGVGWLALFGLMALHSVGVAPLHLSIDDAQTIPVVVIVTGLIALAILSRAEKEEP